MAFWPLEPLSLLYLVTNEYDGSDELGFAWTIPPSAFPGRRFRGRQTVVRFCRTETARTRCCAELVERVRSI